MKMKGEISERVFEEELADKTRTNNGTQFDLLESIFLTFLVTCGF